MSQFKSNDENLNHASTSFQRPAKNINHAQDITVKE